VYGLKKREINMAIALNALPLSRRWLSSLLLLVATLVSILGASPSFAQQPPPPFDRSADFGRFELVPGVFATEAEKQMLLQNGCVIGPAPLVVRIVDRIGNTCDERMFKKLAGVHKSGSLLWMVTQTPVGLKVSLSDKAVNLGNNMQDGMVFPYSGRGHASAALPLLLQQTNSAGGATVRAQVFGGILTGMLNGTGAAAIAAATNPCNGGNCGGTWNIQGGQGGQSVANAGAEAGAILQNHVTAGATINGANTCPTGSCKP
jgi:hypothetical protein